MDVMALLEWVGRPSDDRWQAVKVGLIAAVVIYGFWQNRRRNLERSESLGTVARRWAGSVEMGGFFQPPRLELWLAGAPAKVTFHAGDRFKSKWTKIQVDAPFPTRLRVSPSGFSKKMRSLFGGKDIAVGDGPFDDKFWVEAADAEWARNVLAPTVRLRLMGFRDDYSVQFTNVITADLGPGGLTVKVWRSLVDEPDLLSWFIELTVLILGQARGSGSVAGVVLEAVAIRGGSVCPVCGHAVDGGRMCPACRTPHHEDCWKYSGGCAIFACAGRPQKAA